MMKIAYYEEVDTLFLEFSKGAIVRDEALNWNINIGYTHDGIGETSILEAAKKGHQSFTNLASGHWISRRQCQEAQHIFLALVQEGQSYLKNMSCPPPSQLTGSEITRNWAPGSPSCTCSNGEKSAKGARKINE